MKNINRHRSGFTVIEVLIVLILVVFLGSYIGNIVKLFRCDFQAPYRGEFIHSIGVIVPPAAMVAVWFDDK
jgi:prepilin-type N-terminal cleavage/methylation domain-containing protein